MSQLNALFQKYVKSIRLRPHDMFVHEVRMFQKYVKSIRLRPILSYNY